MKILIFAGGNGTRLWPVSRVKTPKQFQKLVGDKSMFELTVDRMRKRYSLDDIYIVVPALYHDTVRKLYPAINDEQIIIEPCKWDTLACIGYAGFIIAKKFPTDTIFMVWSDHIIKDEDAFLAVVAAGDVYARKMNKVIRIGAKATYPEVNWGYLQFADKLDEIGDIKIYEYVRQHEKPQYQLAKKFVESFAYLWNMGYMIWPAHLLVDAYRKYSPASFSILQAVTNKNFSGDILSEYQKIPKNSIDYEILEKMDKTDSVVIPADVGWNDVGDWSSLKTQLEESEESNVATGKLSSFKAIDAEDVIAYSDNAKKIICVIGLSDIAIVDTKDAILVCSKKQSKDVKKLVEELAKDCPDKC